MRLLFLIYLFFALQSSFAQDADTTQFWQFAASLAENEKGELQHTWGSETVHYLGNVKWLSPSGKELELRIVSSYRRITKANGFNDQSVLALVKTNHVPVKIYDLVSRQNLPVGILENKLIYNVNGAEITSALPAKIAERFCVDGLNCFEEATLIQE